MKKIEPSRTLLGLKQSEMAALLGMSRSHYSLCELGLREFPAKALSMLLQIERHLYDQDIEGRKAEQLGRHDPKLRKHIADCIEEIGLRQVRVGRRIESLLAKQQSGAHQSHLVDFANKKEGKGAAIDPAVARLIGMYASKHLGEHASKSFYDLQRMQKILAYERGLLEADLKSLSES